MGDKTGIEWANATWNPIVGCSLVSPGCTNCYAMKMAHRIEAIDRATGRQASHYAGTTKRTKKGAVWTGKIALAPDHILTQPNRWKRPRRIFVNSMSDLFHESVPDIWIASAFREMRFAPQHQFLILTKRAARMRDFLSKVKHSPEGFLTHNGEEPASWGGNGLVIGGVAKEDINSIWPLPNVWLGVSVEDQKRAEERIPYLLETPAAIRFLSCEPLLSAIDLERWPREPSDFDRQMPGYDDVKKFVYCPLTGQTGIITAANEYWSEEKKPNIDWVIAGGESGPGARPMHPEWIRSLQGQCRDTDTPFFFKQWGEWTPGENVDRQTGTVDTAKWFDDRWIYSRENLAQEGGHRDDQPDLYRVGKRAAGCSLNGRTWHEFPEAAA